MNRLVIKEGCCDCGECEEVLPSFRTKYEGELLISDRSLEDENVINSINYLVSVCPNKCIKLEHMTSH